MTNEGKSIEEIRDYWEEHGRRELGEDSAPLKKRDEVLQRLIEDAMIRSLPAGAKLVDVGCGDGTSTLRFSETAGQSLGLDYAAKRVEMARRIAADAGASGIEFDVGDVTDLSPIIDRHGQFDVCTMIRCLINLPTWEDQAKGIDEIAQCVRPGGLFIVSEGWREGFDAISVARERLGLEPIRLVTHNRSMTRPEFEGKAFKYFDFVDYVNLGFYLFMSRVFQPAFVAPEPPRHDHEINAIAGKMAEAGLGQADFDICDYAGVYILRRREA